MKRQDFIEWFAIGVVALAVFSVVGIMVYLAFADYATAIYIFRNHMRHYFIGVFVAAVLVAVFWRRLSWQQEVLFVVAPVLIASGFPDLVYFASYVVQNASVVGVLTYKNAVYGLMHQYLSALVAGPLIVAALLGLERVTHRLPKDVWFWPLVLLASCSLVSFLHVLLDMRFNF